MTIQRPNTPAPAPTPNRNIGSPRRALNRTFPQVSPEYSTRGTVLMIPRANPGRSNSPDACPDSGKTGLVCNETASGQDGTCGIKWLSH